MLDGRQVPSEGHAASCEACARERRSIARIRDLANDLEWIPPSSERAEAIRSALLVSAQNAPVSRRPGRVVAVAAIAVAACILGGSTWLIGQGGVTELAEAPTLRAAVAPARGARFVHTVAAPGRPELVRLAEGSIALEVTPLAAGERFMVVTQDAEVEVHGTTFEVAAEAEHLIGVRVKTGVVEVRLRGAAPVRLQAGSSWQHPRAEEAERPAEAAARAAAPDLVVLDEAPRVSPPSGPRRSAVARVKSDPRRVGEGRNAVGGRRVEQARTEAAVPLARAVPPNERAFRDAWAAFARGDMEEAAELFARAEQDAPGASLSEDASYGRAVALSRAGRRSDAIAEMERFLEQHPKGARAHEVSVALGWLLVESGDLAEAKRRFTQAVSSPVARVRRSAERGLAEIADRGSVAPRR